MISAIAAASIGIAAIALWFFGVVSASERALGTARSAFAALGDDSMDDLAREKAVQGAALALIGSVFCILGRGILAFAASLAPILAAHWAGLASYRDITDFLARWDVITAATAILTACYFGWVRLCRSR